MKLALSVISIAFATMGFAQTATTSDFLLFSGYQTASFTANQITGRVVGGNPTANHAAWEENQLHPANFITGFYVTGYSGAFTNTAGTSSMLYGRHSVDTVFDNGIASGFTANGTELIATIEGDDVSTGFGWMINPASPPYVLRIPNTATSIGLDNEPVRMSTDGDHIYVLEKTSGGFEVQKVTYASGSFSVDWSATTSDSSQGADIMVGADGCYVISNLPSGITGPAEFFVLSKSTGATLASFAASFSESLVRFATGADGATGEYISGSVANVAVVGFAGSDHVVFRFAFNPSTNALSNTETLFSSYVSGFLNTTTMVKGGAIDTSTGNVFLAGRIRAGGDFASVEKFTPGGTVTYALGNADTPGGIGISGNSHVYLMDYNTPSTCEVFQYNTSLSLLSSNTSVGNPGIVFNDIAVLSSGSSDYVFWSEYYKASSLSPSAAYARAVMVTF